MTNNIDDLINSIRSDRDETIIIARALISHLASRLATEILHPSDSNIDFTTIAASCIASLSELISRDYEIDDLADALAEMRANDTLFDDLITFCDIECEPAIRTLFNHPALD